MEQDNTPRICFPSWRPEANKARYQKWRHIQNTKQAKLKFYYLDGVDKTELFAKLHKIKAYIGEGNANIITTFEFLHRVTNYYMLCLLDNDDQPSNQIHRKQYVDDNEFELCSKEKAIEEKLFLCTQSSI